jgi:hypothetical protein
MDIDSATLETSTSDGDGERSLLKSDEEKPELSKYSLTIVIPPPNEYDTNKKKAKTFSKIKSEGVAVWSTQLKESNSKDIKNLTILVTPSNGNDTEFIKIRQLFACKSLTNLKIVWVNNDGELPHSRKPIDEKFGTLEIKWPDITIKDFKFSSLKLESCPGIRMENREGCIIEIDLPAGAERIDIVNSLAVCLDVISNSEESNLKSIGLYGSESISSIRLKGTYAWALWRKIKDSINVETEDSIKIWRDNRTILFSDSNFQRPYGFFEINIPRDSLRHPDPSPHQSLGPLLRQSSDQSPSSSKSYSPQSPGKSRAGCCCVCID